MRKWVIFLLACTLVGCPASHVSDRPLSKEAPAPVAVAPLGAQQPQVVLLLTGNNNGMLELCDCPGPMPGGLSRRSGLALSYRAAYPNVMLLDAGDVFSRGADSLLNDFVLHAYRQMGYDAIVLGEQEWIVPFERLQPMLKPGPMEYLSTTVSETPGAGRERPAVLTRAIKRQFGAAKLAILSDLRAAWMASLPPQRLAELTFAKEGELAAQVDQLHKDGYVVAVICHGDEAALKQTADSCAADLFVRGHKSKTQETLSDINGRPVLTVGGHEYVGVLGISFGSDGKIAHLEYRRELVDKRWPIDDRIIQTYRDYCKIAMQAALQVKPHPGLDYATSAQCGHCHTAQFENWKQAKHSHAYATLLEVKRTDDPACLSCHTSGFGTVKGFSTFEKTPQLVNVNCQDCHSMDFAAHTKANAKPAPITEATCRRCHTDVTDPPFDFAKRLAQYHCPMGKPQPQAPNKG